MEVIGAHLSIDKKVGGGCFLSRVARPTNDGGLILFK